MRLPSTTLQLVRESLSEPAFLRVRHRVLRARFPDGSASDEFAYDEVERAALDAVVIAAHYRDGRGVRHVYLRSALRPPVAFRDALPVSERHDGGHLWELPAGLVEHDERSELGLRACASRELQEELGFSLPADAMQPLGPSTFPAPSVIAERHFYFHCEVDPTLQRAPGGDGSALERHASIVAITMEDALLRMRSGEIQDAKTEIALRRLAEIPP
jgi:ADP-ribose pyrophosphatase